MKAVFLVAFPALLLAGCDETKDAGGNGNVVAIAADGDNGQVAIKTPGFEAKVNLPGGMISKSNFELDGVKLYPGSSVTGVNVGSDSEIGSTVTLRFSSPASTKEVRDYFAKAFAEKAMAVTATENGLSGTDKDKKPFSITLTEDGASKTTGTIVLND